MKATRIIIFAAVFDGVPGKRQKVLAIPARLFRLVSSLTCRIALSSVWLTFFYVVMVLLARFARWLLAGIISLFLSMYA